MKRRSVVSRTAAAAVGLTAGCFVSPPVGGPVDYPAERQLVLTVWSVNSTPAGVKLDVSLANDNTMGNEATFHDVILYGYTKDGTVVCEKHVGTVPYSRGINDRLHLTVDCDQFPYMLTTTARDGPCTENTNFKVLVYVDEHDAWFGDRYERNCGASLPPEYPTDLPE